MKLLLPIALVLSACTPTGGIDVGHTIATVRSTYAVARTAALTCISLRVAACLRNQPKILDTIATADAIDLALSVGDARPVQLLDVTAQLTVLARGE